MGYKHVTIPVSRWIVQEGTPLVARYPGKVAWCVLPGYRGSIGLVAVVVLGAGGF
jgi:hypothetical protein